ncbi:hypothetical protein OHA10_30705 [Kribbella sp. NBC_00662]|uniref:hypothetical protein n=1 Tax=Kribbella sp. NBC_00662 TaxID=2975969 RepID=UPI0032447C8E
MLVTDIDRSSRAGGVLEVLRHEVLPFDLLRHEVLRHEVLRFYLLRFYLLREPPPAEPFDLVHARLDLVREDQPRNRVCGPR